jgi:hypothetical protein
MVIKLVNWGIANRIGDNILINYKLKSPKFKNLFAYAINHEKQHSNSNKPTFKDFFLDLSIPHFIVWYEYFLFCFRYPKNWWQQSMLVIKFDNNWVIDWNRVFMVSFIIFLFSILIYFYFLIF